MKTLAKLVMLLAVLTICTPAKGEILIYSKTMNCFEATEMSTNVWDVYDGVRKGFLIIDVEYDQNEVAGINQAVQIEFWKDKEGKWFLLDNHKFGYERIIFDGDVYLVLEESHTINEIYFLMLRGKTKNENIGLGRDAKREIPRLLEGPIIEYYNLSLGYKKTCCASLRLLSHWTRQANDLNIGNQDLDYARNNIVKEWLTRHKYIDIDQSNGIIIDGGQDNDDQNDGDNDNDDSDYDFPNGIIFFP
jgi:hypothetical protein